MRTFLYVGVLLTVGISAEGQQMDETVVKSLLGRNFYSANNILDSLGVWYYHHFHENKSVSGQETKAKIYSIEAGGAVKVYMIHLHPVQKHITEIVVNFRHDDKRQVEAMRKMPTPTEWHIGTYSTDMEYRLRSK